MVASTDYRLCKTIQDVLFMTRLCLKAVVLIDIIKFSHYVDLFFQTTGYLFSSLKSTGVLISRGLGFKQNSGVL